MRTLKAYSERAAAIRQARVEQRNVHRGVLVGVERDLWKEPYSYRVVAFDLNDPRDRALVTPVGARRTSRVRMVMYARRLTLIVPRPRTPDVIGDYKRERATRRRRKAAA